MLRKKKSTRKQWQSLGTGRRRLRTRKQDLFYRLNNLKHHTHHKAKPLHSYANPIGNRWKTIYIEEDITFGFLPKLKKGKVYTWEIEKNQKRKIKIQSLGFMQNHEGWTQTLTVLSPSRPAEAILFSVGWQVTEMTVSEWPSSFWTIVFCWRSHK